MVGIGRNQYDTIIYDVYCTRGYIILYRVPVFGIFLFPSRSYFLFVERNVIIWIFTVQLSGSNVVLFIGT